MRVDVDASTIFLAVTGSHAYGTARAGSDVDVRGVCVPPLEVRESPFRTFEQWGSPNHTGAWGSGPSELALGVLAQHATAGASFRASGCLDLCIYALSKFVFLASKANPNILELLFLEGQDVLYLDERWAKLREHRMLFLSRRCKSTYLGYAHSQLKRILTHREWLLNPPKREPLRSDFELPEESLLPADVRNLIDESVKKTIREWSVADGFDEVITGAHLDELMERMRAFQAAVLGVSDDELDERLYIVAASSIGLSQDVLQVIKCERRYRAARSAWSKYLDWKKNRNPSRALLEEKYGFDSKHGAHLVRLMRTGKEILLEGVLRVRRPDAAELLAIRDGELDFDALMDLSNKLRSEIEDADKTSGLPSAPDLDQIERVYLDIIGVGG